MAFGKGPGREARRTRGVAAAVKIIPSASLWSWSVFRAPGGAGPVAPFARQRGGGGREGEVLQPRLGQGGGEL